MAKNCLRITHESDKIRLSWQRGQESTRFADAVTFEHPFDKEALTDLRWYLEEYIRFPYGIYPDNAKKVEDKLQEWGQQLFELVFRSSEKARQFFGAATFDGLDNCELVITSDDPTVLNLPWELLYSPDDRQFLAPSLAGMCRSLSNYAVRAEMGNLPQDKLNILVVIARPYGERDIELRTIARPLLAALQPIQQQVNLKVLRPPSFEEFERELSQNKGFYHIVHFDGHGDFDANSVGFQHSFGHKGQGVLVFESHDGSPQVVTAAQIAQNLADCGVPIFVLNACKSAQEGEDEFSSVATRLVSLGAKGVVAMAYSVYAEAAKHFMGRFYGELVRGATISNATAAGRKVILNHRLRPSPKGDLPLADWMVPVLYQQEPYKITIQNSTATDEIPDIDDFLKEPVSQLVGFPEAGAYGFIGRDYDILQLERAFRLNSIVLLQGLAGVGKTSLVRGFAEWLAQTQGRTGKMFFISFETGASLSRVVNEVGREVWGDKFSNYSEQKQQAAVLKYLQTQPCLLVWDNFEPVNGFPEGNEPLLRTEERSELKQFLKGLQGGKTWVLITSRREETWLDCGYRLLNLGGLKQQDVEELAAQILQTVGVNRNTLAPEFLELLKLLGGHPLSLRVVLPQLKTQTPAQVIEALRLGLDNLEKKTEDGRDKSLTASLDYSFSRFSQKARKHLPFLGLFCERVNVEWLNFFSASPDDDEFGQAYRAVFGENLQKADWINLLNEAPAAGIVEDLGVTIYYKLHPALPWFLRQRLTSPPEGKESNIPPSLVRKGVRGLGLITELEKKLLISYAILASNWDEQLISNAKITALILRVEEPNLLQNLRLAEQQQEWFYAQAILQPLGKMYQRIGRKAEFKSLRQRSLKQIGMHLAEAKAKGKEALNFWMYLRTVDANEALDNADLEGARGIYQEILDELMAINDSSVNDKIATAYHNLGMVAEAQRQFKEAQDYYLKSLNICENAGDFYSAATDYHQLGRVVEEQRQFKEAQDYYLKALEIYEDAGDFYSAATDYHQLGRVAEEQRQFEEALDYYFQALKIYEDAGDLHSAAREYHQLGMVAQQQQQFEEARAYYFKALKIYEDAGDFYSAAREYHQLGIVAYLQRQFEEARAYYFKALKIYKDAGDFHSTALSYGQLGLLAQEQRLFEEAINYYQKAFDVFNQSQDWYRATMTLSKWGDVFTAQEKWREAMELYLRALGIDAEHTYLEGFNRDIFDLARLLQQLGESQFIAFWLELTGYECAGSVREEIWAARDRLELK